MYKCDDTAADACDDDDGVAESVALDDECKSYFAGELIPDECMLDSGDVSGYEA